MAWSNAFKHDKPVFVPVRYDTLEQARAARERTERAFGCKIPKSNDELRLEAEEAARNAAAQR